MVEKRANRRAPPRLPRLPLVDEPTLNIEPLFILSNAYVSLQVRVVISVRVELGSDKGSNATCVECRRYFSFFSGHIFLVEVITNPE